MNEFVFQQTQTVVMTFVPGKFGLCRQNPWQPLAGPEVPRKPGLKTLVYFMKIPSR